MSVELEAVRGVERLVGEVLGARYRIEARLGEGAMGAVYRAKHVKMGRLFAVKVLHARLLVDDKVLQRFEREAELAGRLRHPNVIGVVDVGETNDGLRYMVMDFAEGPDLATVMAEAPMPPERIIHLTRQLLEGLFHAHERGLIHRDFKPENVIIEKDTHGSEVPRIVDFGIAILREGGDSTDGPGRLTTNGLVLGTPHYMAPEQAVADPIDHRIDLFALGIIVYELLSGKLPFDGSGAEVARANLLLDPPPIAERVPNLAVDPLLEAFARRLMAKKREHRPPTAKAARDLLDLIANDRAAAANALGVTPSAARMPMITADAAPVRAHTGNETFPPPIRAELAPTLLESSPLDASLHAPAMTSAKAVDATARDQHLTTDSTEPPKRRAPLIAAAVAGVTILGVAAVVVLKGGDDKPAAENTIAMTSEPTQAETPTPVEAEPPTPTETQVEPRVEAPPVEAPSSEVPPVEAPSSEAPPVEAPSSEALPVEAKLDAQVATPPKTPKLAKSSPKITKASPKTASPTAASAKAAHAPAEMQAPITANALAAQYQSVGRQLKALQTAKGADVVNDLWSRYRMIRISDALSTQPKRDAATAILSKLSAEIATRKK